MSERTDHIGFTSVMFTLLFLVLLLHQDLQHERHMSECRAIAAIAPPVDSLRVRLLCEGR